MKFIAEEEPRVPFIFTAIGLNLMLLLILTEQQQQKQYDGCNTDSPLVATSSTTVEPFFKMTIKSVSLCIGK